MKDDFVYQPVDNDDYQRTVTALEREIARLQAELLPMSPMSAVEADKQQTLYLELDRLSRYLAYLRDKALATIQLK